MTTSGEPPSRSGGVEEPDWIDQILARAVDQVGSETPPIVPDPVVTDPVLPQQRRSFSAIADGQPVTATPQPNDGLAEIKWVDTPEVVPAGTPIATAPTAAVSEPHNTAVLGQQAVQRQTELVPAAVGRSAWDSELSSVGDTEPDGWDKLSWEDLDERRSGSQGEPIAPTSFGRIIREWGPVLFGAVVIALFTRLVLVQAYHIPSESMVPTLESGDRVVVNRLSYQFGEIERGQVVVFSKPQGTEGENDLIKRVIGLPGETIQFADNKVFINGLRVEEPYLLQQESTRPRLQIPGCAQAQQAADLCQVPADHVFVMGDNRLGSSDSRVFGPVPTETVVGRAFMRVWPLNHFGQL